MPTKSRNRKVPKFSTEATEAKWWDKNRESVENNLLSAMRDGTIRHGTARSLIENARASRNVTIRLAEADLDLARKQAGKKGLPYQTYIKSLLHEALTKRAR